MTTWKIWGRGDLLLVSGEDMCFLLSKNTLGGIFSLACFFLFYAEGMLPTLNGIGFLYLGREELAT